MISYPPAPGAAAPGSDDIDERRVVHALARGALAVAAPEELMAFDAHPELLQAGTGTAGRARDEQLGIGVELIGMLAPYVVAAATAAAKLLIAAMSDAAKGEITDRAKAWLRRLLGQADPAVTPPPLPAGLLARVRAATYDVCLQMGADPGDATLVSDAVAGRLTA